MDHKNPSFRDLECDAEIQFKLILPNKMVVELLSMFVLRFAFDSIRFSKMKIPLENTATKPLEKNMRPRRIIEIVNNWK